MLASPKGWEVERRGIEVAGAPARWRDPLALALLAALSWALWVRVTGDDLAAMLGGEAPSEVAGFARWAALLGRIGGEVVEAGFYALAWRAFGRPVRFSPLFLGIAGLSTLDAIGNILVRAGGGEPAVWIIALAGARAVGDPLATHGGLDIAFGGLGLLTALRIAGTAWLQARDGVPMRAALGLTAGAWVATRLATWWTTDLMRGMSPLP